MLDALDIDRTRVLGTSLGGMAAATLAANAPERVERLVLASTSVRLGPDAWWDEVVRRVNSGGLEAIADHLQDVFFSEAWQLAVPDRCASAREMFLATDPGAFLAGAEASRVANLRDVGQRIRASTLVIAGEDDPMFRWSPATDLLNLIEDAEALHVGGAKHRVLLEQPVMLGPVINEFLSDPDAR